MKQIILLIALFSAISGSFAQITNGHFSYDWSNHLVIGGPEGEVVNRITDTEIDPVTGETYSVGTFSGTMDFDPGPGVVNGTSTFASVFLVKYNSDGSFAWVRFIQNGSNSAAYFNRLSVELGSNFVVIGGSITSGGGVAFGSVNFNPSGVGDIRNYGNDVIISFVTKFDFSGVYQFTKDYRSLHSQDNFKQIVLGDVEVDNSDNIYLGGWQAGAMDFDPNAGTTILGNESGTGSGFYNSQVFVSKLSSAGLYQWGDCWTLMHVDISAFKNFELLHTSWGGLYLGFGIVGTTPMDIDPGAGVVNVSSATNGINLALVRLNPTNGVYISHSIQDIDLDHLDLDYSPTGYVYAALNYQTHANFTAGATAYNYAGPGGADNGYPLVLRFVPTLSTISAQRNFPVAADNVKIDHFQYGATRYLGLNYCHTGLPGTSTTHVLNQGTFVDIVSEGITPLASIAPVWDIEFNDVTREMYISGSISGSTGSDFGYGADVVNPTGNKNIFIAKYMLCDVPILSSSVGAADTVLCVGESLQLSAPFNSNWNYSWTGPDGFTSTQQNPTIGYVTSTNAGTYTLVVSDQLTGCSSVVDDSATVTITVNALPVITKPIEGNNPCEGDTVILTPENNPNWNYSWSGPNGFSSNNEIVEILNATPSLSGTYTVTVTNQVTGCSSLPTALGQIGVTVNPNPVITTPVAADNNTPCEGDDVQLDGQANAGWDYSWSGPNGFTSSIEDPVLTNVGTGASGTYTLVVTDQVTGCSSVVGANAQTTVTVNPNPVITTPVAADNNTPCEGDDVQLDGQANSGWDYSWSGPNGFTSSVEDPVLTNVGTGASGTYTLVVTDQVTGCSSVVSANAQTTIMVNPNPVITTPVAAGNNSPCEGEDIVFSGQVNAGWDYSWTGPNGFTSNALNPVILNSTVAASGTYTLVVTDQVTGCSSVVGANAQTTVTVNPNPVITTPVAADNNTPCEGEDVQLDGQANSGWDYSWSGPNGFTSSIEDPILTNVGTGASGTYTLVVTDQVTGCSSVVSANAQTFLIVNLEPVLDFGADTIVECYSATYTLTPGVYDAYYWGNGSSDPEIEVSATGWVTLIVANGSCLSNIDSVYIDVNNSANVIDISHTDAFCLGDFVEFEAFGGGTYSWTGPNGFTSDQSYNSILVVSENDLGAYSVMVQYPNGCFLEETFILATQGEEICNRVPEIVTNNGDGLNDYFELPFLVSYPNNRVLIFNRWGTQIFEAAPYNNDFSGVPNKGGLGVSDKSVPNGTYFYLIDLNGDGSNVLKGYFELQNN